jgi:hypothetical protein
MHQKRLRARCVLCSGQQRVQAVSVNRVAGRRFAARDLQDGREQIADGSDLRLDQTGRNLQ